MYQDSFFQNQLIQSCSSPDALKNVISANGFQIPRPMDLSAVMMRIGMQMGVNPVTSPVGGIISQIRMWAQEGKW